MRPFTRRLIDEPDASFLQVGQALFDVIHRVGDMVHAFATLLDELRDSRIFGCRLKQFQLHRVPLRPDFEECNPDILVGDILDADRWPAIKAAYIELIEGRFDDDLAETWFNSVFFKMHRHDQISDRTMFVHSTRPPVRKPSHIQLTRGFISGGCLYSLTRQILTEYTFDVPWADMERDVQRMVECLRNGLPLEMDVYDAALWSAITPLSEWSVGRQGEAVKVPDFTRGSWKANPRGMDISLKQGGDTLLV